MTHLLKNPERQRYEATRDTQVLGYSVYRDLGDVVELPHTVVEPAFEGQGIASAVVRFALDDIRASGRQVLPTCSFVARYIQRHPTYADMVARCN
ncbi:MAG: N-acetyltransferase [Ottowia sp.]|nr:N-acetyltransferase [Ottowia sp.]